MPRGFTLIEVVVVLLVMGLALALAAPAFIPREGAEAPLPELIRRARDASIRRGEAVTLRVEASGAWRIDGLASKQADALASGRLPHPPASALTFVFSPLGTCAPALEGAAAGQALALNPLTCETGGSAS